MGHLLRREGDEPVKKAWDLEVEGLRGKGRPKITWKVMVKKESSKVGVKKGMLETERSGKRECCIMVQELVTLHKKEILNI